MSYRVQVWLSRRAMKSAYELAMERLSKSAPAKKLSSDQKARIADLESLHRSKVAQREIALADEVAEFAAEKQRLEEDLEAKKQRVSDGA